VILTNVYSIAVARRRVFTQPRSKADTNAERRLSHSQEHKTAARDRDSRDQDELAAALNRRGKPFDVLLKAHNLVMRIRDANSS
jgi:hypothetical protein